MSKKQKHIITLVDDGTKDKKGNNSKKSLKKKKKVKFEDYFKYFKNNST